MSFQNIFGAKIWLGENILCDLICGFKCSTEKLQLCGEAARTPDISTAIDNTWWLTDWWLIDMSVKLRMNIGLKSLLCKLFN